MVETLRATRKRTRSGMKQVCRSGSFSVSLDPAWGNVDEMTASSLGAPVARPQPHPRSDAGSSAVPALEARPASIPECDRRQAAYLASGRDLRGRVPVCYLALSAVTTFVGLALTSVDRSAGRFRVVGREARAVDGRPPDALPRFPFVHRLGDLRRDRHSGADSGGRDHLGLATAMVARRIRALRDRARVGDVPDDGVLRRTRPSRRRTTRRTPGRRQLPLGSRRGVDRRVLGLRAPSHLTHDVDARQGARVGRRARDSSDRGGLADVPRDAPPARHARRRSHGDRRADAGPAPRAYHRSRSPAGGRHEEHDDRRGRCARRQDVRRRAAPAPT